ncbi:DUF3375 domain-containing protein [Microbacterium indicum]|uniref:DUF3375 domain-containing protein n=1 Tax=Microbacterium indicum TaxID=358100 RepID=UPI0004288DE1|nr:DUF3375 domain-containing protein [Microbacterium indicum]
MTRTRAEAAYQRALAAFRTPTLDLLHGRQAPFVVAALTSIFTADRPAVAVSDAHVEVDEILGELRAAGYDDDDRGLPAGQAREICRYWVRVGWLIPQIEDDVEVYRLSAHAVGALEITGRTGGRTRVSTSRVRTLLDAVDRLAGDADLDPERRLERLTGEKRRLEQEIARLEQGEHEPLDDEELLEEAENVLHLARELPADFTRVAESIKQMQRDVVADLRRDVRPTGEVLREYLERGQHIMQATPEGRAFAGALRLIGDPDRIDDLTGDLHALLAQPFSRLLDPAQRVELDAIARRVEQGVEDVLTAQRRASHVITQQVRTHDPVRDRQVDDLLRDVMAGLQAWQGDGSVDPLGSLPTVDVGQLRQTLGDIRPPGAPAPLTEADDVELIDGDTRAWGGPHYAELEEYVRGLGDFDLAEAFAGSPSRRPVDLVGLLEITLRGDTEDGGEISYAEALRPDGTTRRFAFGAVSARAKKEQTDD